MNDKQVYFNYLDEVRRTGQINMMGAVPYLEQMFGLSRLQARDILIEWMDSKSKGPQLLQEDNQ